METSTSPTRQTLELPWIFDATFVYGQPSRISPQYSVHFQPEGFDPEDLPKRTSDIGTDIIDEILESHEAGEGAIGSFYTFYLTNACLVLVNRRVYRDDTPFWLGLVKSGKKYHVVYRKL
jgi:hypothetical protein